MMLMLYNDHAMILLFLDTSLFLNTLINLYDINKNANIDNKKIWLIFYGPPFNGKFMIYFYINKNFKYINI